MRPILSAVVTILMTLPLAAATLDVSITDDAGGAVPHAVAYAVPSRPLPLARRVAVMDQVDRAFVPHVLPVQTGTWVEFPNSDSIRHMVYSVSPAKRFQLPLYIGKPARPIQFDKAGVVAIGCNIHEQMGAYIVVVDTPYFGTAANGRVALRDLPAGEYTVRVWYPGMRAEPKPQSLTVGATDQALTFVASRK
ncbi:MAG TPA: hypothetical protein VG106_05570 [Vicinamibacterales bacterium]|nr:hypothetical protein [Vicinamibacterales bacterium]